MLGAIYFNNHLCRSTVKVHNEFADNSLFVNFYRIFAEKKIPELALMGSHFSAKPPGVFQLAVIFWYGHIFPSQSASPPALPKGEPSTALHALRRKVYRSALLSVWQILNWYAYVLILSPLRRISVIGPVFIHRYDFIIRGSYE